MASCSGNAPKSEINDRKPVCLIILGMAGSGKTTFVQTLTRHLHNPNEQKQKYYNINLDPACKEVPYPVNIDIKDTVNYKKVMEQYKLGPNGGIVTSLNLYATKFDQVTRFIEKRQDDLEHIVIDTPGQIEVFTWSASGTIITETLASSHPTVIVYVMDIVRSNSPITFMSNMLYACSILYKTRLPFVVVMNKIDIVRHDFALEWMRDCEAFSEALNADESYMSTLSSSLSLVLDKFYSGLKAVGVSAATGEGMAEFVQAVAEAKTEYYRDYKPEYDRIKTGMEAEKKKEREEQLDRIRREASQGERVAMDIDGTGSAEVDELKDVYMTHGASDNEEEETLDTEQHEKVEEESFGTFLDRKKNMEREKCAKNK